MITNSEPRSPESGPGRAAGPALLYAVAALAVLAVALAGDSGRSMLRYERTAVLAGEWWRLITAHLAHLGWTHTVLNLAGLALAWLLFGREFRALEWLLIAACSVALIGGAFLGWRPELAWYVGLSGVLHGLFAAGSVRWMMSGEAEGLGLGLFLAAKLAWEQLFGALPLSVSSAGGPVVVDAHLAGAVGGTLAALALWLRDWNRLRR